MHLKFLCRLIAFCVPLRGIAAEEFPLTAVVDRRETQYEAAYPGLDQNARQAPLRIAGRDFGHGVGTQVNTSIAVELNGATHFSAWAGVDDASSSPAAIAFRVVADGQTLWRAELRRGQAAVPVELELIGRRTLVLITEDIGNAATEGLADWAEARFAVGAGKPKAIAVPRPPEEVFILTPQAPLTPRINGAKVYGARPGHPFLFQIAATGERPMQFSAEDLPAGLVLDAATGRITGVVRAPGTWRVALHARNARGAAEGRLRLEIGEEIALTPAMGWNSWNSWAAAVDQEKVLASARAMAARGLVNHGWTYINIDDTWQGERTGPDHALQSNAKFPDMRALAGEIHALGLKIGIYSTPMITSYTNFPGGSATNLEGKWTRPPDGTVDRSIGPYHFAAADAKQWADWGIDYLKYDWYPNEAAETREMTEALRASGRDIVYSLSNDTPFRNAAVISALANSWRTSSDIDDSWGSVCRNGLKLERWRSFARPGHWNDPDMLVVGQVGWGAQLHASRLTPNEQYTHLSLWCLLSAPLLIGCPIDQADDFTISLLTNDEVLAVDQDELAKPARQVVVDGRRQVWVKELADGSRAIGLFNLAEEAQPVSVAWAELGLRPAQHVRDLWRQQDLGLVQEKFSATIPRHGVILVRVWP